MEDKIQAELDRNKIGVVKYGFVIILLVIGLAGLTLSLLQINGESVIQTVFHYYFR